MVLRATIPLDGTWTFAPDPHDVGLREGWTARPGFDRPVEVPAPWQLYGADMRAYTGAAWYHRAFETPELAPGAGCWVRFGAVDWEARVWVNGVPVGEHRGGYMPFACDVAAHLRADGPNDLVLRVLDPADNAEIPHGKQGSWYTRVSGPWLPVTLEVRPAAHVAALRITPEPQAGRVRVRPELAGAAGAAGAVSVTIQDPGGNVVAEAVGEGELVLALPGARLWSPDDPALYTATARLGDDAYAERFGMRWVEVKDGLLHLNGAPLYVRGALDQGFWPQTIYRPPSVEAIEREILLAKGMGLNLLRKHIKAEDPRYLEACDRLGMLVWAEPACFAKYTPQATARFEAEIRAMIARDFNRPSVIAWSLYNEEWGLEWRLGRDPDKQAHVEALFDRIKALDPTRPICDNSGWAHVKTDLNDYHRYFNAPDQAALWEADLDAMLAAPGRNFVPGREAAAAGVPLLVSEFGVWGLPEPSRITRFYGGEPWWFDAVWAGHTEEFKYPATAIRNFERFGLAASFGDLDGLARACQARMMRALKPIVEAMRRRPGLAGYVVTELTDIEWEGNGWLDYFREPKADADRFMAFNGPIAVMATLEARNFWPDGTATGTFWVSNHTGRRLAGAIRWTLGDRSGEVAADVAPHASIAVGAFAIPVPAAGRDVTPHALAFELVVDGAAVARNEEPLTVTGSFEGGADGIRATLHGAAAALGPALEAAGAVAGPGVAGAVWVTDRLDAAARDHAEAGGRVLYLAEAGDQGPDTGGISFRRLPPGESWDRAAAVFTASPALVEGAGVHALPGWEWDGVFPAYAVPMAGYLQDFGGRGIEQRGNQAAVDPAGVLAGYFEGWLGKYAATALRVPTGRGEVLVTTLRLVDGYGRDPVATRLLERLLRLAAG